MAVVASKVATPVGKPLDYSISVLTDNDTTQEFHTMQSWNRNVRSGPMTLFSVDVDNTITGATKTYVQIYDNVLNSLVPGTTAPQIIFPVPAVGTNPNTGRIDLSVPDGLPFVNGMSVSAATEAGDVSTTPPVEKMVVTVLSN